MPAALLATIPSPAQGVWWVGPLPIRAYGLLIVVGILVAVGLGGYRWQQRGGRRDDVLDVAMWAVPAGIIGGRVYHVLTDWQTYFGAHGRGLVAALRIWDGGLGIWGAISLGFVGAWIGCRRLGIDFASFADACAPGIVFAQAIGRLGNWFNQELFGRPFSGPWALAIDPANRPAGYAEYGTFHPTFLYELIGAAAIGAALIALDRGNRFRSGQVFALYVLLYCAVRFVVESFRIDTAHTILGLRLNEYTALAIGLGAYWLYRRRGARAR